MKEQSGIPGESPLTSSLADSPGHSFPVSSSGDLSPPFATLQQFRCSPTSFRTSCDVANSDALPVVTPSDIGKPKEMSSFKHKQPKAQPLARLAIKFFCVLLVSWQFGLDSTLWLPTVFSYLTSIVGDPSRAAHYLSLTQTLPAVVQVIISLTIGLVAAKARSLKWPLVVCVVASVSGSLLYVCAGKGAIGNAWAVVGARMLCGFASGASALAMSYIVIGTTAQDRLSAMSLYRTGAGMAMVLGPLVSIGMTQVSFQVSGYHIDGDNAPVVVSFCIASALLFVLLFGLENKSKASPNAVKTLVATLKQCPRTCIIPAWILLVMLVSAYAAADVMYLLSETLPGDWHFSLALTSGLQAAVYAVALIASLGANALRSWIMGLKKHNEDTAEASESSEGLVKAELVITIFSFTLVILGLLVQMVGFAVFLAQGTAVPGTATAFLLGSTLVMAAYNLQASALPSLFSKSLPPDLCAALTPWYAATVAAGKIFAPLIDEALAKALEPTHDIRGSALGHLVSRGVTCAMVMFALFFLLAMRPRLVQACA